jgi:large subunit ribosomal protein L19e
MMLTIQRRLAAEVLNCAPKDVRFEEERLKEIKEAITKVDIRSLVKQGMISKVRKSEASRARAREIHKQKVAGKQKGQGSRKGTKKARGADKTEWINKVRSQRTLIRELREKKVNRS